MKHASQQETEARKRGWRVGEGVGRGRGPYRIAPTSVVTAQWVRLKCQYGCSGYGLRLTCPPHSPTPSQTRVLLEVIPRGAVGPPEPVHQPVALGQGDRGPTGAEVLLLRRILQGFPVRLRPTATSAVSAIWNAAHTPPKRAPLWRLAGMDVYATARVAGFPIEAVKERVFVPAELLWAGTDRVGSRRGHFGHRAALRSSRLTISGPHLANDRTPRSSRLGLGRLAQTRILTFNSTGVSGRRRGPLSARSEP